MVQSRNVIEAAKCALGAAAALAVLPLMIGLDSGVDEDLARANYVEGSASVVATSYVVGERATVTTADGRTFGLDVAACPGAPAAVAVGDVVTTATLPSVRGSRPLTLVGPCDPVALGELVVSERPVSLTEDAPYGESRLPVTFEGGVALSGGALVTSAVLALVALRARRREDAEGRVPADR